VQDPRQAGHDSRNRIFFHVVGSFFVVALVAVGCTAPEPDRTAVVVGVLSAGGGSNALDDATRGAQLAIDIVNSNHGALPGLLGTGSGLPGLGGAKLSLVSADSQGKADQATRQAADIVKSQHAVGMIVADAADVAAGMASEMQRLRVPLLDASNTADYLTELGMDWYFRAGPSDRSLVDAAFALMRHHGVTRIAVVTEPGGDSAAGLAQIQAIAESSGSKIVLRQALDSAELAVRLGASDAQAVVAWAHTTEGAAGVLHLAPGLPNTMPIVGLGKGFRTMTPSAGAGPLLLRTVVWSADLAQRSPPAKAIAALYQQRFGQPMSGVAAAAFTSAMALALAIDASGSRDPAAVRAALRQISLPPTQMIMPWDGVRFSADGHNSLAGSAVEAWDGSAFRVIYPAELAAQPLKWPGAKP
jgi:branched-chain amino acid transport system substrate-binding protein